MQAPFSPPGSVDEAEAQRQALTIEIQRIQGQLGDRQRSDGITGRRLSANEYFAWRRKAVTALNAKLATLRELRQWIRDHRPAKPWPGRAQDDLLERACVLLEDLRDEEVEFDPAELQLIDDLREMVDRRADATSAA